MTKDIEREAFEEFYKTQILTKDYEIEMIDQLTEFHIETGLYEYARMQTAWQSWQAAKAYEAEKSKGCVMVPVESIEAALLWMDEDIDAHHMSNDGFDKLFEHKPILEKILLEAARGGNE